MIRQFKTDYPGSWHGYCKTRESAIKAATRRILEEGEVKVTIIDQFSNGIVAEVLRVGRFSVHITVFHSPLLPRKGRK